MTCLEGVYWDLDGTIANTELEAHLPAFNNAFKDLDINWNWDTKKYIQLLRINGGKNRIAYYSKLNNNNFSCLLYTSPSPRDSGKSRMPSSA